jgi:hypothetical protein
MTEKSRVKPIQSLVVIIQGRGDQKLRVVWFPTMLSWLCGGRGAARIIALRSVDCLECIVSSSAVRFDYSKTSLGP